MKNTKNKFKLVLFILTFIFFISCSIDDDNEPLGDYENGYFIINEGNFGSGTGTLTFVDYDENITQNVYQNVNNEPIGNVLQSVFIYGDFAYLVVNNSHKVVVVNRYTMKKITTIDGESINNPRYMVANGNMGYISNWGDASNPNDDFISVINLTTNTIVSTILVGEGPEKMLIKNNDLYVNLQGGWGFNNKVAVINTTNNIVVTNIVVGDVPSSIILDQNQDIWVLCSGIYYGAETAGKLVRINNDNTITSIDFLTNEHPWFLTRNYEGNTLYYNLNNEVYKQVISITESSVLLPELQGVFNGMSFNNNKLYALDAGDFASEGKLKIFNTTNNQLTEITTGIVPNSVVFQ